MKRVRIREDMLSFYSIGWEINSNLPFRLQKRELFTRIGFPIDEDVVSVPVNDDKKIAETLNDFAEKYKCDEKFLIIISPKPMPTWVPPLFSVSSKHRRVAYRNEHNFVQEIDFLQIIPIIKKLPQQSWVEFARYIWGGETIAGRLVYVSREEQILEMQKGVEIPEMDKNPSNSLLIKLSSFEFSDLVSEFRSKILAQRLRFDWWSEIRRVIRFFEECRDGLDILKRIAPMPAIEFARTRRRGILVLDVDWPSQYYS